MATSSCGELLYDVEKVKVKVLKRVPEIRVGEEVLGPFPQDQEVEIERWIAKVLEEGGYVEIVDEKKIDLTAISKIAWKESRTPQLIALEPTFYVKARNYLKSLVEKVKASPEALNEKRLTEARLIDVINSRTQKIVNLALTGAQPPREVLDCLTPEERVLFNEVCSLISRWRRSIRGGENG